VATEEMIKEARECLDKYENTLRDRIDQLNSYKEELDVVLELMEEFPQLEDVRVQFTLDSGTHGGLICTVEVDQIKALIEPLRFLRERLGSYKVWDDADMQRRIYKFRERRLAFQAWFWNNKSDEQCRYVEVGKKEVPVYELRCGEEKVKPQEDIDV
jgi:hypothetical protein